MDLNKHRKILPDLCYKHKIVERKLLKENIEKKNII